VAERSTAAGEVPAGARLLVALDFLLDPDAQVRGVQVGEIFVRIHD
jgi:hypothetical protein